MLIINIEGEKFMLPTKWGELNITAYNKFAAYMQTTDENTVESDMFKHIISAISSPNISIDTINKMQIDSFISICEKLLFIFKKFETPKLKKYIKINKKKYTVKQNFNNITLGQWTDLEHIITNNSSDFAKIISFLIEKKRSIIEKLFKKNSKNIEENEINSLDICTATAIITKYFSFRNNVYDSYYKDENNEDNEVDNSGVYREEYGWVGYLYNLCSDVTKVTTVSELPLLQCLNWSTYQKSQIENEKRLHNIKLNKQ